MLDLEAIKARHAAATAEEWELLYETVSDEEEAFNGAPLAGVGYYVPELNDFVAIVMTPDSIDINDDLAENLTFIAAAHADVPALIAEVERLQLLADMRHDIIAEQQQQNDRLIAGLVSSDLEVKFDEMCIEVERLRAGITQIASDLDDEDQFCQAVAALLRGVLEVQR